MRGTPTWCHDEKVIQKRRETVIARKLKRTENFIFLDFGNIRIIRFDDLNLAVEKKRESEWELQGYFGSAKGAIEKVINLTLDINQRATIKELLERFREVTDKLLELASLQAKQFEHDADAKHAKMRGGKK